MRSTRARTAHLDRPPDGQGRLANAWCTGVTSLLDAQVSVGPTPTASAVVLRACGALAVVPPPQLSQGFGEMPEDLERLVPVQRRRPDREHGDRPPAQRLNELFEERDVTR